MERDSQTPDELFLQVVRCWPQRILVDDAVDLGDGRMGFDGLYSAYGTVDDLFDASDAAHLCMNWAVFQALASQARRAFALGEAAVYPHALRKEDVLARFKVPEQWGRG